MSDLFENLSNRFSPGRQPIIRPRPQSRFEGDEGQDGLQEQNGFETARARNTPHPQRAERPDDAVPAPATRNRPDPKQSPAPTISKPEETRTSNDTTQETPPEGSELPMEAPKNKSAPKPRKLEQPDNPRQDIPDAREIVRDVSTDRETISEIHREVIHTGDKPEPKGLPTIQTKQAALPSTEVPLQVTNAAQTEPSTIVRIGKVEIRQPAPPALPPSPPTPPRAAEHANMRRASGGGARQSSSSGLTDYLGWKRR
ncbi:hypothetical protein [Yoonia sp. BS5-3]|uniref:Uncharacterized protein n=1 Tax=Yoonia phaeophyticola TaxID=3137369 RepID=A0ABZ2V7U7_9RHOB